MKLEGTIPRVTVQVVDPFGKATVYTFDESFGAITAVRLDDGSLYVVIQQNMTDSHRRQMLYERELEGGDAQAQP